VDPGVNDGRIDHTKPHLEIVFLEPMSVRKGESFPQLNVPINRLHTMVVCLENSSSHQPEHDFFSNGGSSSYQASSCGVMVENDIFIDLVDERYAVLDFIDLRI
jgi:hypothetical protein